jgi:hypothetical protein
LAISVRLLLADLTASVAVVLEAGELREPRMATTDELKDRIAAFARELAAEMGEVDDSEALSWLDAIETQAVEIGDAVHAELVKQTSATRPPQEESTCPGCGQPGRYEGQRERELIGRRGPVTIAEPEYFCPCCRKAFFPADDGDRR